MDQQKELNKLVDQLEGIVETISKDQHIPNSELRRILIFLVQVVQVVSQSIQEVLPTLIEFKYLSCTDLQQPGDVWALRRKLDQFIFGDRHHKAETICDRLHQLRTQYDNQISPYITRVPDRRKWENIFRFIEDREGDVIILVYRTVDGLIQLLDKKPKKTMIHEINSYAAQQAEIIKAALNQLQFLTNEIMGLSGHDGFLELTEDRSALTQKVSILLNKGTLTINRDVYSARQVGAMGPNARARNMTFQEIWCQINDEVDLPMLASELAILYQSMSEQAISPKQNKAVREVDAATVDAMKGNGPQTLLHLKKAGSWALDVATKIGVGIAETALKASLGL